MSARTYLSYIAEQAGGFACIGRDGKLYIKTIGENIVNLPIKYLGNFKWGEKFKISRVRYADGVQVFQRGTTSDNTVYIEQENMYIVKQEQIDNIFEELAYLEIYSFEGNSIIDPALDVGDILQIDDKQVIYQGNIDYAGKWKADILSKIQCKNKEETTTRIPSQKLINRRVQSSIDETEGKITLLVDSNNELVQKTSKLEIDVDTIKGEISEIADVTMTAEGYGTIEATNINESEPILMRIYPTSEDIIPLRPHVGLRPHIGLRPHSREIYFKRINETESEEHYEIEYNLPCDLYRLDDLYDEFVLDYENLQCYIIHRVGLNENGEKYALDMTYQETFEYPDLHLSEGDYQIIMPAFANSYIYVRLMAKNIYTSQFATKVELSSKIEQTVNSIDLSVTQKLSNYSTTQEMQSAINLKADSITSSVSATYQTKSAMSNYSTTTQMNSAIQQKADSIISSVSATYQTKNAMNNYSTTTQMNSAITQKANEITSSVSITYETKSNANTTKTSLESQISQTASSITAEITNRQNADNALSTRITANANGLETKVSKGSIISTINQSAESVTISANKVNLSGYLTITSASNTYATKSGLSEGTTTINGGCITTGTLSASKITTGTLDASQVTVKNLDASKITSGTLATSRLSSDVITTNNFSAQNINASKITSGTLDASRVSVTNLNASNITTGTLSASKISGGSLNLTGNNTTITSTSFSVDKNGSMTAKAGKIGGWNITESYLQKTVGNYSFEIRTDRPSNEASLLVWDNQNERYNFYVRPDGYLFARNGEIAGKMISPGISASNISAGRLNISDNSGHYLRMGFTEGNNPSVSGLNVGSGGISFGGNSGISGLHSLNMSYEGNTYPSKTIFSLGIRDYNGGVHYLTFVHGILSAWNYVS